MPHFSFLPEEEIRRVAEKATVKNYRKGTVFAEQDKTVVDSIYVVTNGVLELLDEKKGTRMHSGLITAGEVFGGITIMMNGGISLRTVIVDEDCSGYEIPRDTFQDLCRRYKSFYEYFLENFSKNIIDESIDLSDRNRSTERVSGGCRSFFIPARRGNRADCRQAFCCSLSQEHGSVCPGEDPNRAFVHPPQGLGRPVLRGSRQKNHALGAGGGG